MSRGDRRRTGRNLSSGNTRTGTTSRVLSSLKSRLSRTKGTRDTTRSNAESNAFTTNQHQSSDPEKDTIAPAEQLPLSNPHLHDVADDMKEDEEDS